MHRSQKPLPLLGMGTWGMGGKFERDESNVNESITALQYGLEHGITMIDVAEIYGEGLSEEIVGEAIKNRDRQDVYIVSKVWKENLHHNDVLRACEGSLTRLKTDYIDLYLVHWPNPLISLKETMGALEQLYDEGKIRAIGVSNFTPELLEEGQSYLHHAHISVHQFEYNLTHHEADVGIIPYCHTNNITLMGYRPYAKGKLTESISALVEKLGQKYKKTANQITLNWVISQGISAIPKSSSTAHLNENIGALGWNLSQEDIELLRNATLLHK